MTRYNTGDILTMRMDASTKEVKDVVNVLEIKAYMARRGDMTNKELATKIGISPATLTRWFEKRDMPTSAAEKMMNVLEIPVTEAVRIFFVAM